MRKRVIGALLVLGVVGALATACTKEIGGKQREAAIREREQVFEKAQRLAPTPQLENFPTRKALVKFTERQDLLDHPWYVYILSDFGSVIGYYVAQTRPVNSCDFLSSTEKVFEDAEGNLILTAPSLDGIFYGGAGASSGCDEWFFFDSATDALIEIRGVKFFTADQPLRLEAEPIMVEG